MMGKILDFYDDQDDFEAALDAADRAAVTDREMEFVSDLREKLEEYGTKMFLSDNQNAWLKRIIDGD